MGFECWLRLSGKLPVVPDTLGSHRVLVWTLVCWWIYRESHFLSASPQFLTKVVRIPRLHPFLGMKLRAKQIVQSMESMRDRVAVMTFPSAMPNNVHTLNASGYWGLVSGRIWKSTNPVSWLAQMGLSTSPSHFVNVWTAHLRTEPSIKEHHGQSVCGYFSAAGIYWQPPVHLEVSRGWSGREESLNSILDCANIQQVRSFTNPHSLPIWNQP